MKYSCNFCVVLRTQVHIIEPGVFKQTGLYGTWRQGFTKAWDNLDDTTKREYGNEFFEGGLAGLDNSLKISNSDSSIVPQAMVPFMISLCTCFESVKLVGVCFGKLE